MSDDDAATRIREAALDLFGRHGIRETSTRSILKLAGLRNPSAISYHFGSKAGLVDDLVSEVITDEWPVVIAQTALAKDRVPTIEEWAGVMTDSAVRLVSTDRGCMLARVWWEYDCFVQPDSLEHFLASGVDAANDWIDAVVKTFPHLPPAVAIARNIVVVRTVEWLIARVAGRVLSGQPKPLRVTSPEALAVSLNEVSIALLSAPTTQTDADITFG